MHREFSNIPRAVVLTILIIKFWVLETRVQMHRLHDESKNFEMWTELEFYKTIGAMVCWRH